MTSDSATKVPTQQSVKAYVDANAWGGWWSFDVVFTGKFSVNHSLRRTCDDWFWANNESWGIYKWNVSTAPTYTWTEIWFFHVANDCTLDKISILSIRWATNNTREYDVSKIDTSWTVTQIVKWSSTGSTVLTTQSPSESLTAWDRIIVSVWWSWTSFGWTLSDNTSVSFEITPS
jgi:hypothetical protein